MHEYFPFHCNWCGKGYDRWQDTEHCCLTVKAQKRNVAGHDQKCPKCQRFVPKGFTCCGKVSTSLGDKAERDSHDHFTHRSTRLEQQRARQQLIRDLNKIAVVDERAGDDCSINPSIEQTEGEVISSI
jgi:hypothetical protein